MSAEREAAAADRAYRAGAGTTTIDDQDEDMVDAALLATPDASGSPLWRPSRLDDIYDLPDRVLRLYLSYRAGQAGRGSRPAAFGTIGGEPVKGP